MKHEMEALGLFLFPQMSNKQGKKNTMPLSCNISAMHFKRKKTNLTFGDVYIQYIFCKMLLPPAISQPSCTELHYWHNSAEVPVFFASSSSSADSYSVSTAANDEVLNAASCSRLTLKEHRGRRMSFTLSCELVCPIQVGSFTSRQPWSKCSQQKMLCSNIFPTWKKTKGAGASRDITRSSVDRVGNRELCFFGQHQTLSHRSACCAFRI